MIERKTNVQWIFLVIDNEFNRANSKELIGKRFEVAPSYTCVKYERELMDEMTTDQLVAFWNIYQSWKRMFHAGDDGTNARLELITNELLTERGVPHEAGKRIKKDLTPA